MCKKLKRSDAKSNSAESIQMPKTLSLCLAILRPAIGAIPAIPCFGGVTAGCQIYDRMVMDSIPGRVAINWLLQIGWVTVCQWVNHLGI